MCDMTEDALDRVFADRGLSAERMVEIEEKRRIAEAGTGKKRDGRLCACGHGFGWHEENVDLGRWSCGPGKSPCACTEPVLVAEVSDQRVFQCRTDGPGNAHALLRGLTRLAKLRGEGRNVSFTWAGKGGGCWHPDCKDKTEAGWPVPMNKRQEPQRGGGAMNLMVCWEHLVTILGEDWARSATELELKTETNEKAESFGGEFS